MSVKAKDRHKAKRECLQKSRELVKYVLLLTQPKEFDKNGKQIRKPGPLAEGQPFYAFGNDLIRLSKQIHAACYTGCEINLKNEQTFYQRKEAWDSAIKYCDSIFRQIDLCIFQYAQNSKKKFNSFKHLAELTWSTKKALQDRINRDTLISTQRHYVKF